MAAGSSNAFAIAGGVVAAGAIGVAAVWFAPSDPQSGPAPEVAAVTQDAEITPSDAPQDTSLAAADLIQTPATAPTIDTFFRSPDDTTVIAGQAEPGQVVAIMVGGDVVDTVTAGADGAFGTVLFIAASDQPRRLRLIADPDGAATPSAESVIIPPAEIEVAEGTAPQDRVSEDVTAFVPETDDVTEDVVIEVGVAVDPTAQETPSNANAGVTAEAPTDGAVATTPDDIVATMPDTVADTSDVASPTIASAPDTPPAAATAPPTLISDAQGVRVLQAGVTDAPVQPTLENIALDTITYDPSGEVLLAGRGAAAGGFVRVYLDNKPIIASRISDVGDWRTDLPQVDTGIYTLRVDEVNADGVVQSRIETPFKKEEAADVAAILAEETSVEGFDIAVKTVQPGATLWAIAEEQWGDGIRYVSVFEANRDLIRDPDLIYPGQVFRIPQTTD